MTFVSVVRGRGEMDEFVLLGGSVLGLVVKVGFEDDVSVCNSFITFCLRLGKPEMAHRVFEQMGRKM